VNVKPIEDGIFIVTIAGGKSTGEAFVQFQNEEEVELALKKDHSHIGRRYIEVYKSNEEEKVQAQGKSKPWAPVSQESIVVRMRGLPFATTEEQIKSFFEGLEPLGIHILNDYLGRPSGDAYVEFSSEDAASKAMQLQRKNIGSRYIELFRSSIAELTRAATKPTPPSAPSGGSRRSRPSFGGDETSSCVRVQGIPFNATESDITRFFQDAGVTPVRIHRKHNGGEAFVEFSGIGDARQAMTLQKAHIGNRYIELFRVSFQEMADTVGLPASSRAPPPSYGRDSFDSYRDPYRDFGGRGFRDPYRR